MNCAQCREWLVAYLEDLLDDPQKQAVEGHVKECETCRTELGGWQTLRQRLVGNGRALAQGSVEDQVMNRIIREQSARLKAAASAGAGLQTRRLTMKSSIVKLTVAAAVVLACGAAWFLWSGTDSGVALADVLVKVEQVQAFMYKMTMHVRGSMQGMALPDHQVEVSMLVSNEHGMRMDMSSADPNLGQAMTQQMYLLPQQKMALVLMPALKKYMRMEFDDEMFEEQRRENNDPRWMLKQILECQYTDLGRTVLDGVEVQGFQTTDPAYGGGLGEVDVTVWVSRKTELPVRVDMKIKMGEQMEMEGILHEFLWDIPVSAAQFDPVIPPDFTAGPGDGIKMPAMTEETALSGLRLCLELNGKYPEDLNLMTLIQMAAEGFKSERTTATQELPQPPSPTALLDKLEALRHETLPQPPSPGASREEREKWIKEVEQWRQDHEEALADAKKMMDEVDSRRNEWPKEMEKRQEDPKELMEDVDGQVKRMMDKMIPIQALGGFYMMLVQEQKEPAYYGKVVQAGDVAQVLLRWKTGEDEYRVIFADLHAETVNADTLAKLEAALPE
jgi:anti-sigma factor RsiW